MIIIKKEQGAFFMGKILSGKRHGVILAAALFLSSRSDGRMRR